ncbi:MAG: hypothetical protein M1818_002228 [Claussenomyces sp. TS43310]|nr:MAG: hypothetical protein M1818_002228 [Claussenomyces sp. TS43310]
MGITSAHTSAAEDVVPSYHEVVGRYRASFAAQVARGEQRPLVLPRFVLSLVLLGAYLCVPHWQRQRAWLYRARWLVLVAVMVLDAQTIRECGSMNMASAFGGGLVAMYSTVLAWTWLVWYRPQFEARRVGRRRRRKRMIEGMEGEGKRKFEGLRDGAWGNEMGEPLTVVQSSRSRPRRQQEGQAVRGMERIDQGEEQSDHEYYWQAYPMDSVWERIDWVLDLVSNFRGQGWNWSLTTNPPLPAEVQSDLGKAVDSTSDKTTSSVGMRRFTSRSNLIGHALPRFLAGYLMLDLLKVVAMTDPYFILGPNEHPLPAYIAWMNPLCLRAWRELQSLVAIYTALATIFLLSPLFFHVLLGPRYLGVRGAIWQYPSHWGDISLILDGGLGACWNGVWHQAFRQIFAAPTQYLVSKGIIERGSSRTKLVGLFMGFFISGLLHGSGSITQLPPTKPWNPMLFFLLQGAGVALQTSLCRFFGAHIAKLPTASRRAGNVAFALAWLFYTSPLLLDDLARGGVWLYEPVPVSLVRGLGFGRDREAGFLRLNPMSWYSGKHWWESGLAI